MKKTAWRSVLGTPHQLAICVVLLSFALLAASCETVPWTRVSLSDKQLRELEGHARFPDELGLRLAIDQGMGPRRVTGFYAHDSRIVDGVALIDMSANKTSIPVVEAVIDGRRFPAAIDTGASISIAGIRTLRDAGIVPLGPPLAMFNSVTFDGTRRPVLAVAPTFALGDIELRNVPFAVLSRIPGMVEFLRGPVREIDLLIGQDLLRRFGSVTFAPGKGEVRFAGVQSERPLSPVRPVGAADLVDGNNGIPRFQATINNQGPVDVIFDSGGGFGLWVPQSVADRIGLSGSREPMEIRVANRIFQPSLSRPVPKCVMRIGGLAIAQLTTYVGEIEGGKSSPDFVLLGNHVLRKYGVRMNYRDKKIEFLAR